MVSTRGTTNRPRVLRVGIALGAALMGASALGAQTVGSALTVDTVVRAGHADLTRYTTPTRCYRAVLTVDRIQRRSLAFVVDTTSAAAAGDTLTPAAVTFARARCGQAFEPRTTPRDELPYLMKLALAGGDDARAAAAAARWLQLMAPDTAGARRGWHLLNVMHEYLLAQPMRVAAAESAFARLDALGPEADTARYIGHVWLFHDAMNAFDVPRLDREVRAILALQTKLRPETAPPIGGSAASWIQPDGLTPVTDPEWTRRSWKGKSLEGPWIAMFAATVYRAATPAAARATWDTLATLFKRSREFQNERAYVATKGTTDEMLTALGAVMQPLRTTYWYGRGGATAWPVLGKVNLTFDVTGMAEDSGAYPLFARLRRLHEKYGDRLAITFFASTRGYRGGKAMPAAEEAEWLRQYFLDYLKLPVNLGVDSLPMKKIPDGRVFPTGQPAYTRVRVPDVAHEFSAPALVDREGRFVLVWPPNEAMTDAFVARLLERGVRTGSVEGR